MGLFSNIRNSTDGLVLNSTQKDIDEFFEGQRVQLSEYYNNIKTLTLRADTMAKSHKGFNRKKDIYKRYIIIF